MCSLICISRNLDYIHNVLVKQGNTISSITVPKSERISLELLICFIIEDASPSTMKLGIINTLANKTASLVARASANSALDRMCTFLNKLAMNKPLQLRITTPIPTTWWIVDIDASKFTLKWGTGGKDQNEESLGDWIVVAWRLASEMLHGY